MNIFSALKSKAPNRRAVAEVSAELRRLINEAPESFKESFVPWAPKVPQVLCDDARLFGNRKEMFSQLVPKDSKIIEVGTQTGKWARDIIDVAQPSVLHVVDIDYSQFDQELFAKTDPITVHKGYSWDVLETFPDGHFDCIYIDASHEYSHVKRDAIISDAKLASNGILIFNDYTTWSPYEVTPYGVLKVVNEILSTGNWKIAGLALHPWGYHDIALIRI